MRKQTRSGYNSKPNHPQRESFSGMHSSHNSYQLEAVGGGGRGQKQQQRQLGERQKQDGRSKVKGKPAVASYNTTAQSKR